MSPESSSRELSRPAARRGPSGAARALAVVLGLALAFGVLEIGLRLRPQAISGRLLLLFEPGLRERIAGGTFMVKRDFVEIARDDSGPPLYVRKPGAAITSVDEKGHSSESFVDELGFCNAPGAYRSSTSIPLIAVGDSFTWCHDVKAREAWVARIGERAGIPTYNLGRGGSGLYEHVQVLRHFGLEKHPRVVVLNVYEGNDLRDAAYYWDYRRELERTGVPPSDEARSVLPGVTNGVLGRSSYAVNLVVAFLSRMARRDKHDRAQSNVDFRYALELPDGPVPFNVQNRDRDEVEYARLLADREIALDVWEPALRRFGELAREHDFRAIVSYTPSAHTAYGPRVRFASPDLAPSLAGLSRAQREFLSTRASELGYEFHDLTPALQEAAAANRAAGDLLYDPASIHLTPAGHDVISASLVQFLQAGGYLRGS